MSDNGEDSGQRRELVLAGSVQKPKFPAFPAAAPTTTSAFYRPWEMGDIETLLFLLF